MLKVFYTDFPATLSTQYFDVLLTSQCDAATLTIDDTILKAAASSVVTLTQYVNNSAQVLQWSDS